MARCPECAGKMTYNPANRLQVCNSCGLSLSKFDLDRAWRDLKDKHAEEDDDFQRKKSKRKEWLEWYSSKKD